MKTVVHVTSLQIHQAIADYVADVKDIDEDIPARVNLIVTGEYDEDGNFKDAVSITATVTFDSEIDSAQLFHNKNGA